MKARPEVVDTLPDSSHDPLPRRLGAFQLLSVMLRAGLPCKMVPESHWERETVEGDISAARVRCPCGNEPVVEVAAYPKQCECHRWFFYSGPEVWALGVEASSA